jgi:hypothetical protein
MLQPISKQLAHSPVCFTIPTQNRQLDLAIASPSLRSVKASPKLPLQKTFCSVKKVFGLVIIKEEISESLSELRRDISPKYRLLMCQCPVPTTLLGSSKGLLASKRFPQHSNSCGYPLRNWHEASRCFRQIPERASCNAKGRTS